MCLVCAGCPQRALLESLGYHTLEELHAEVEYRKALCVAQVRPCA
jgi:hypothetical protein